MQAVVSALRPESLETPPPVVALDRATDAEFTIKSAGEAWQIAPRAAAATRRCLRPIAALWVGTDAGAFPEINISMGRIPFDARATASRNYRAFSQDAGRTIERVLIGPEEYGRATADCIADLVSWMRDALEGDALGAATVLAEPNASRVAARLTQIHGHIHGWFHPVEMLLLHLAAHAAPVERRHTLEIGSFQGRSTAVLAAALHERSSSGLLLSVDPNEMTPQQAAVAAANVGAFDPGRRLVQVQRRSDALGGLLAEGAFGLIFIDGSHEFDDVMRDFAMCDRLLGPGGILLLHDIYPTKHLGYTPAVTGPTRCLDECILPTGRYEPLGAAHLTFALRKSN